MYSKNIRNSYTIYIFDRIINYVVNTYLFYLFINIYFFFLSELKYINRYYIVYIHNVKDGKYYLFELGIGRYIQYSYLINVDVYLPL